MRALLTIFSIFLFSIMGWAQEQRTPNIQVNNLSKGESPVRVSQVKVDVKVVGALAVTTVDMTFHNPNNRILEGELQFPLAEGQSISRFALDINGKLREGVVVEKAKGQEVFESVIRRRVDPGLLEKTEGNNFRTRVYPLPAKGTRRIVIAYEQELSKGNKDEYQFFLPVEYRDVLDDFSLNIAVYAEGQKPTVDKTPWGDFQFDRSGEGYIASYSAKKYPAQGQLVFSIPIKNTKQVYVEQGQISDQTILYAQIFPTLTAKVKQEPKSIALFWDASSSMSKRNLRLEMDLLESYFNENTNLKVYLHTFNCIQGKEQLFSVINGDWSKLKNALQNVKYDGATQIGALDFSKLKVDEILLFSDGLSNFGQMRPVIGNTPVSVISSSLKANHSLLKYINATSGGAYVNLMNETPQNAVKLLANESFRLISIDYDKSAIGDLTTSGNVINSKDGFTMAGILKKETAVVTLSFGIGNRVQYTDRITINKKDTQAYGNILERIWAEKKIAELDMLFDINQKEIEAIGRKYNIVTRNTSLIVLDDVQDYITNRITPPAEFLDQYNRAIADIDGRQIKVAQDNLQRVLSMLERRKTWWNRDFQKEIIEAKKRAEEEAKRREKEARERAQSRRSGNGRSRIDYHANSYNGRSVSGIVKEESGEPIIGATVQIKGTRNGVVTDFDGKYSLSAKQNDILVFNYLGMTSIEVPVRGSELNVILAEDNRTLDEVVVVGYGVQRRRDMVAASVSVRESEQYTTPVIVEDEMASEDAMVIQDNLEMSEMRVEISESKASEEVSRDSNSKKEANNRIAKISLNAWNPDTPYLKELKATSDVELYSTYLAMKGEYESTPSFFLEVSTLFEERGFKDEALIILSNLAELEVENYRLIRVLAHRLKQMGYNDYAINQFEKLVILRPEEPQTFRDLGLAYVQSKDYQKAIEVLYKIVERKWDSRFPEVEMFAVEEINNAIEKAKLEKVKLDLSVIDNRLINNMPVNIRIVLNWDTDNSDMDLWVIDPNGEKCYYGHKQTAVGGLMTFDFTGGYGPEEFLIKNAIKGKYKIQANYYGSREQTLVGPTTIYLDIFTYYSSGKEKKETITLRLSNNKETIDIGEIVFE